MITAEGVANQLSGRVLSWYARHRRDLPWRTTRDPYHIWISEVMLQQTRVDTVVPYYRRFLSRFPDVRTLAEAPLDDVLKVWENLGYYARAHHVHAAAKEIMGRFNGRIPCTWNELTSLPGVGTYTAGAILSIAFGQPVPAVDGNVRRVLSRLFAVDQPLDQVRTHRRLMELAWSLVPVKGAGIFNQGLMDFGADICTPRNPACTRCPIMDLCQGHQDRLQDVLPIVNKRTPIPHSHVTAGVIRDDRRRILIVRRHDRGLLGGLWKFPGGLQESDETLEDCLRRRVREEVGIRVRIGKSITLVKHAYTHFRITLHAFQCAYHSGTPEALGCVDWRWMEPHRLNEVAFSKADRRIMDALMS